MSSGSSTKYLKFPATFFFASPFSPENSTSLYRIKLVEASCNTRDGVICQESHITPAPKLLGLRTSLIAGHRQASLRDISLTFEGREKERERLHSFGERMIT